MLNRRFKEYFTFTKKERNGIIMLLIILLLTTGLNILVKRDVVHSDFELFDEEFKNEVELFEKSLELKEVESSKLARSDFSSKNNNKWFIPQHLFYFDPNNISKEKLKELGLSVKQIDNLIKYRKSGGVFYNKNDLLKIYGIEKDQFEKLELYILIENKDVIASNILKDSIFNNKAEFIIELNSAKIDDLIRINGIGEVFAQRIIKYRNLLGGFIEKDQLLEVKGIDTSFYLKLEKKISIDTSIIKKINLNNTEFNELIRHPYVNKYEAQSILKFKKFTGKISNLEQILENNLIDKDNFFKLRPYLEIE